MTSRRAGKRQPEEEDDDDHDRWLITYADMVTLLMVLFIVLFAMSEVDRNKFDALKDGLAVGFGQPPSPLDGSTSMFSEQGMAPIEPINPQDIGHVAPQLKQATIREAVATSERQRTERKYAEAVAEVSRLDELRELLFAALRKRHLENDVRATIDSRGLTVSLISEHVVFRPNIATLTDRGRLLVDTMAPVLRNLPDSLEIDGHTNQVRVKPKYYPTDWELSSARAVSVLRHLNEQARIPDSRLSAVGYGHTKPLVDPDKPGSQAVNKRVDIVISSRIPDTSLALLDQAAREWADNHKKTTS